MNQIVNSQGRKDKQE